jgi:hypothetical protein
MPPQEGVFYERLAEGCRFVRYNRTACGVAPYHATQAWTSPTPSTAKPPFSRPFQWPTSRVTCPWPRWQRGRVEISLAAWFVAVVGADIVGSG